MTHRTRPAHLLLRLNLVALVLLHVCAFAPQLRASQTASRNPALPAPEPPVLPAPVPPVLPSFGVPIYSGAVRKEWLLYALSSRQHDEAALVRLVERRGSRFRLTAEDEQELREAGATDRLLEAVRTHYPQPATSGGTGGGMAVGPGRGGGMGSGSIGLGGGGPGNPGRDVDYKQPFRQSEVTRRAIITFKPDPGYTEEAHKNKVEGLVRLRAVLNFSGKVTNISVIKGLPDGLTEKAIAAARLIRFTPAEKDGRAVSQYVFLEYGFTVYHDKGQVDEPAIILEKPEAEYTEEARRNNVRGKVVLRVTLTSFGGVAVEWVKAGLPHGLTEKAAEAAERIVFEPARLGGRVVSQRVTVEYVFNP